MAWQVIQGDCLDVMRGMDAASVDAVVCDPPYGIAYQSSWRTDKAKRKPPIANDAHPFIWWLYPAYQLTKPGGCLVCFCHWREAEAFRWAIEIAGYTIKSQVIWDREWHGMGDLRGQFAPQHDVIWFAAKGKYTFPGTRPKSVLRSARITGEALVHPTEKPVDLMRQCVRSVTPPGGTVLDPFTGSGSTGCAAVLEGFDFVGIEMDAEYCEIARRRIAHWAGEDLPLLAEVRG